MSRLRRRGGITILEIMIAMSLMSVVIIAFAATFPSGYRLNYASHTQAKATGAANAIAEQFSNLSVNALTAYESSSTNPTALTTANLNTLFTATGHSLSLPEGVIIAAAAVTQPNQFWIDATSVTIVNRSQTTNPFSSNSVPDPNVVGQLLPQIVGDEITVTVYWFEYRRGAAMSGFHVGGTATSGKQNRSVTVKTLSTSAIAK